MNLQWVRGGAEGNAPVRTDQACFGNPARYWQLSRLSNLRMAAAIPSYVETRNIDKEIEALDPGLPAEMEGVAVQALLC